MQVGIDTYLTFFCLLYYFPYVKFIKTKSAIMFSFNKTAFDYFRNILTFELEKKSENHTVLETIEKSNLNLGW